MNEVSTDAAGKSRTALVPIAITCPNWCDREPAEHAADIWNHEGRLIHSNSDVEVRDTTGWTTYGEPVRFHPASSLYLSAITSPDGRETESPILFVNGREHSLQQASELASEILRLVAEYRAAGGVA